MKKAAAVLGSAVLYAGAMLLSFLAAAGNDMRWFLYGFPVAAAIYFVLAGNVFSRRLQLNRWYLWLGMNVLGGLAGWAMLAAWFPVLLSNGFILVLLIPLTMVLAVVWAVVGIGFLCVKLIRRRSAAPKEREKPAVIRPERTAVWMEKAKNLVRVASIPLLILAAASLYVSVRDYGAIRPADSYVDEGVHTFVPYDILPISVKNNATGRYGRTHPTKIVYMVYYKTTDGSGYRWQVEGSTARTLAEQKYEEGPVERRVLSIPEEDAYITVEADQTAKSYTAGLQRKYTLIMGLSVAYLAVYAGVWIVIWRKREMEQAE